MHLSVPMFLRTRLQQQAEHLLRCQEEPWYHPYFLMMPYPEPFQSDFHLTMKEPIIHRLLPVQTERFIWELQVLQLHSHFLLLQHPGHLLRRWLTICMVHQELLLTWLRDRLETGSLHSNGITGDGTIPPVHLQFPSSVNCMNQMDWLNLS